MFLLSLLSTPVIANESVTLGTLVFPPHTLIDEQINECVGDFISITKKILSEYDINVDVVCSPSVRVYRLLKNADINFTINVKSTKALPKDIIFVDTPFGTLNLELYAHNSVDSTKSVAAIRGFSYHDYRNKLKLQGYEFIDLPTSISAIQLFLKKRSSHLIFYRSPVDYYIQEKKIKY